MPLSNDALPAAARRTHAAMVLVLTLSLAGALALLNWSLQQQADGLAHSQKLMRQCDRVLALLFQAESAQRGYLISGEAKLLASFEQGATALDQTFAAFEGLGMTAEQRALVADAASQAARWRAAATKEAALKRGGSSAYASLLPRDGGAMAAAQADLDRVRQEQREREDALEAALLGQRNMALGLGLLGIAGTGMAYFRVSERLFERLQASFRGQLVRLSEQAQALEASNEELATQTEELQAQQDELRALYEHAKELEAIKGNFVGAVSHELRTPLSAIMGYAEFLEDELGGPLSESQRAYVEQLTIGARRLELLVNDLLDFTKLEDGSFKLACQPGDLGATVQGIAKAFEAQFHLAGVALVLELPASPLLARMDSSRTEQVLANFLSNALKFTPAGGRVTLRLRAGSSCVRCEVADSGVGIAEADQARVFERFIQLDGGTTRRAGGAGLGLSIAKALVEAQHGRIGLDSTPGAGSTFWFELPAAH